MGTIWDTASVHLHTNSDSFTNVFSVYTTQVEDKVFLFPVYTFWLVSIPSLIPISLCLFRGIDSLKDGHSFWVWSETKSEMLKFEII